MGYATIICCHDSRIRCGNGVLWDAISAGKPAIQSLLERHIQCHIRAAGFTNGFPVYRETE